MMHDFSCSTFITFAGQARADMQLAANERLH
jgi:hypothetical protein